MYLLYLTFRNTERRVYMTIEHIIFDVDGTLIDTETAILKTWQLTLKEYGYDFSLDVLATTLGIPTAQALTNLGANVDRNFEKQWITNYHKEAHLMEYFPGIKKMLNDLNHCGIKLGIVTSRRQTELDRFFSAFKFEKTFEQIITVDDTTKHKPEPEPLLEYLAKTKTDKQATIYIDDMQTDITCANQAEIASGIVTWGGSNGNITNATYTFSTPAEITALFG